MAWNAADNLAFFQRLQNLAREEQNNREERARLLAIMTLLASPGGVDDATFVDTAIATKVQAKAYVGGFGEYENFYTNVAVGAFNRKDWLTPFLI